MTPQMVKDITQTKQKSIESVVISFFDENKNPKYSFPQDTQGNNLVHLREDGIVDQNNKRYWFWDSFIIERIYKYPNGEKRIDFNLNGVKYHKIPFGSKTKTGIDIVKLAKDIACISKPNYLHILLHQLLNDANSKIPFTPVVSKCGFTLNRWQIPPDFEFESKSGIKQLCIKNIQKAMQQQVNQKTAWKYARELYNATSVEDKDILFAWMMIAPFFDALLDETDLRPCLILEGDNSTGKTQIAKLITKKIWGNFEEVIAPNNLQSDSRTDDYLCTSTFGVVFDDVDNLDSKILGILKSYTTSRVRNQKKNLDHGLELDDEMIAWIILTCNELPSALNDPHFLSRVFLLPINTQPTEQQKKHFKSVNNKIPDGYLGKFFVETTKNWKVEDVLKIYNQQEPQSVFNLRQNTIYRLILTGAELFEHVFGFQLQIGIDELTELLITILTKNDKDILTAVILHIQDSMRSPQTRILSHTLRNGVNGVVYTSLALNVINKEMDGKKLRLGSLRKILRRNWKDVPKTEVFTIKGHSYKGIFIPEEYWKETE